MGKCISRLQTKIRSKTPETSFSAQRKKVRICPVKERREFIRVWGLRKERGVERR